MVAGVQVKPCRLVTSKLKVTILDNYKVRYMETWLGNSPNMRWVIPNNSIENLREGVLQRVLYHKENGVMVPPRPPVTGLIVKKMQKFTAALKEVLPSTSRISYKQVLKAYTGRKLNRYIDAMNSLLLCSVRMKDSFVKAFLKLEKSKPDFVPRVVSPRNPRYNLELLTYLQRLEKIVFESINRIFGSVTVFKGLNSSEAGIIIHQKWQKFRKPIALGFDAVRFDQHVSTEMLQWEHSIYESCFSGSDKNALRKLLKRQLRNRVYGRAHNGTLKYKIDGTRMSGDVNTSLGNCLIMCGMVYSFCKKNKIGKFELCNNGDDCVLIIEGEDLGKMLKFDKYCNTMGFIMVMEKPVHILEKIQFCQCNPVRVNETYRMIRNPIKSCSKDNISLIPRKTNRARRDWLHCVGSSGMSMSGGVPIFQEFYSAMLRSTVGAKIVGIIENGLWWMSRRMNDTYTEVDHDTRISFWQAFGIDSARQIQIETFYAQTTYKMTDSSPSVCLYW